MEEASRVDLEEASNVCSDRESELKKAQEKVVFFSFSENERFFVVSLEFVDLTLSLSTLHSLWLSNRPSIHFRGWNILLIDRYH